MRVAAEFFSQLLGGQAHLVEHGVEQVRLVFKVPIHRAPGHAGRTGNVFQAGVGNAFFQKQYFGRGENGGTGFFSIFFGAAHSMFWGKPGLS
ncbi:hypothetical protein D3C77_489050 [compost metagenome]